METNTSRMINLNGSNYQLWKTRTKDFLYVNGFHQPMICSKKPDDQTNEEWNLFDHRVCGFIRHWVDDSVLNHVSEETNAHSLWSKLEQLYAPNTSNSTAGDVISVELDENNVLNCEVVNKKRTFSASQKPLQVETVKHRYPNGPSSLMYGNNRKVRFCTLENPKKIEFSLELSSLNNYDDVVERVASHLNLDDPSKIRLTPHKRYKTVNKPQPIRHRGFNYLSDILPYKKKASNILCYEVLDIPLPELQGLKTLKVAFHHAAKDEVVIHTIRLPIQSTVGDLINDLKTKVELSHKDAELRLLEVSWHKISNICSLKEKIQLMGSQYWTLRAEEIPEEEKNLRSQDRQICVYHTKNTSPEEHAQNFGEPFIFVIREGETLAEVKIRIQKKLRVPDEAFYKWKFACVSFHDHTYHFHPTYLQDSDVLCSHFQKKDIYLWIPETALGIGALRHYIVHPNTHVPQISGTTFSFSHACRSCSNVKRVATN